MKSFNQFIFEITNKQIATAIKSTNTDPSLKQIKAGNYEKGRFRIHGLEIAIENPKGSTRSGVDKDGHEWSVTMNQHYGEISKTDGADSDPIDVFIGSNPESELVVIIDQTDKNNKFDEHKVMLGFLTRAAAIDAYKSNYEKGFKVGPVSELDIKEFKEWLKTGNTKKSFSGIK